MTRNGWRLGSALVASMVIVSALAIAGNADDGRLTDAQLFDAAKLATPDAGDRMPLCPDQAVSDQLKQADYAFGPCVPISDEASPEERAAALADADIYRPAMAAYEDPVSCPSFEFSTSKGAITATFPCGSVVREPEDLAKALVEVDDDVCIDIDYVPPEGGQAVTKRSCLNEPIPESHENASAGLGK